VGLLEVLIAVCRLQPKSESQDSPLIMFHELLLNCQHAERLGETLPSPRSKIQRSARNKTLPLSALLWQPSCARSNKSEDRGTVFTLNIHCYCTAGSITFSFCVLQSTQNPDQFTVQRTVGTATAQQGSSRLNARIHVATWNRSDNCQSLQRRHEAG
jgi:hypothetical protein